MFRTLTLRGKLVAAFSLVCCLMAALAAIALSSLGTLNRNSVDLGTNWLPSVEVLGKISEEIPLIRLAQFRLSMLDPAQTQQREAVERLLAERTAAFESHRGAYVKLISSDKERETWQRFEAAWQRHQEQMQQQVLPLAKAGKAEEARALLAGESLARFEEARGLLDQDIQLNVEGADHAVQASQQAYAASRLWMAAVSVGALLCAMALALLISRHVLGVIGGEPADVGTAVARITAGDLSTPVAVKPRDTHSILANIGRMQAALRSVVQEVRAGAESVASASSQIAQGNLDLSARTEEQAASLQQTAASVEQMAGAVRNNAGTASEAHQLANGACEVAQRGGAAVQQVVDTMAGITAASRRIADIIGVIDGIAFQTNILALNASVEAARAGEHGKGFAVVAGEVRTLAQRSATAAREIKDLIQDSAAQVENGSKRVGDAGTTMADIVNQVRRVSDLMGEITAATQEQSSGITQINTAVSQLDQTTQQNAALVEESAAASESLKAQGTRLLQAVGVFRLA
jgi:methyl-accepting chemotaxis protein